MYDYTDAIRAYSALMDARTNAARLLAMADMMSPDMLSRVRRGYQQIRDLVEAVGQWPIAIDTPERHEAILDDVHDLTLLYDEVEAEASYISPEDDSHRMRRVELLAGAAYRDLRRAMEER